MLHFSADVLATAVTWLGLGGVIYWTYARHHELAKVPTPVVLEERPVMEEGYARPPVVLPVARPSGAEELARSSAALAASMGRHVLVLHVVTVPEQLPISAGNDLVAGARDDMRGVMDTIRAEGAKAELLIRIAHRPAKAIIRTIQASRAPFCVLGWRGRSRGPNRFLGSNLDAVLREANCNFVVMQDLAGPVRRILFPVSNPQQAQLSFAVTYGLARRLGADTIDVVTLFGESVSDRLMEIRTQEVAEGLAEATDLSPGAWREPAELDGVRIRFQHERTGSPLERIVEMSGDYDLMVLGAGPGGTLKRHVLGKFTWTLSQEVHCPVVVVRRRTGLLHFQLQSFFEFFRDEEAPALEETEA
jgi:CIC family chloride channel protein